MEFLTIIAALLPTMTKALELGVFRMGRRKKVLTEIRDQSEKLKQAIAKEGAKIRSYLEFDNIISEIDGKLNVILGNGNRLERDEKFWDITEPTHEQLQNAVRVTLHQFDLSVFEETLKARVETARPQLEAVIQESKGIFDVRNQEQYIDRIRRAKPYTGQMNGFANMILRDVSKQLVAFGGV